MPLCLSGTEVRLRCWAVASAPPTVAQGDDAAGASMSSGRDSLQRGNVMHRLSGYAHGRNVCEAKALS